MPAVGAHEEHVVWLEDPNTSTTSARPSTRPAAATPTPYARDGRMVGYALLDDQAEPDPDSGLYKRRVFFLLPHDRDSLPGGLYREGAPGEAVDPRTIEVKKVREKTPRSQSGPAAITGSRS
ncbi:DUF6009 family protein [Streptomyces sp. AD2-2]|nr:DUF6009 family protein [Streptomyces sp. AD2-2]